MTKTKTKTKMANEAVKSPTKRYEYTVEELSSAAMITDDWRTEKSEGALVHIVLLHESLGGAKMADDVVNGYIHPTIYNLTKLLCTAMRKEFKPEMAYSIFEGGRTECIRLFEALGLHVHSDHQLRHSARRVGEKAWAVKWKDTPTKDVIIVQAVTQDEAERMMPGYEPGKVAAVEISQDEAIAMIEGHRATRQ
ncbi:hypothetical protein [Myxococcus virescens]|uniref:Uncharacterized protein n=1 Tax=Myxococcus virescens TaxID=83456 RepID=A0A511HQ24_9BACT|nr:hypothetical protein [Myxococcus virescens]GEL75658.1 hypothetical protein MVI01_74420 [Myxococcus virescens]SDE68874.1 hypothetical protein SAMN04488504_1103 [Myxococcus virescens]